MGTTCYLINTSQTTKATIERDQTQSLVPGERNGYGFDYLVMKGSTGYGIMYRQDKDTLQKIHFGIVFKTSRHKTDHWGMTEFCIKEITEDMGPAQRDAPRQDAGYVGPTRTKPDRICGRLAQSLPRKHRPEKSTEGQTSSRAARDLQQPNLHTEPPSRPPKGMDCPQ